MSHSEAYSLFWRKNVSVSEPAELANLLRALRKVAGHLGPNVGRIEYMGMSHGDSASIVLDPSMAMGKYPVDPRIVDYMVGQVVHEALHKIEWSEHVWRLLNENFSVLPGLARVCFQKIIHVGEDIYIDRIADRSILGNYVRQTRGRALMEARTKLRSEILTFDALVYLWWVSTWASRIRELMEPVYEPPLVVLQKLTADLEKVPDKENGITKKCEIRASLYKKAWKDIEEIIKPLAVLDKRILWYPPIPPGPKKSRPKRDFSAKSKKGLAPELAQDIETQLAHTSADITPIIRSIVGNDNPDVAPISRWDFNIAAHPVIDRKMVGRLKAIFVNYSERQKIVSRGLKAGKIDGRRLYRAPVSGKCFVQKDFLPCPDWNVTLLLDATGSMRGGKWRMVENTVGNIHRALSGNHLGAWAYFEMDGICMMSRLISGKNLLSVPPNGQTASGQAIIAAAYFMPKDKKRKLLIHVTDGESNFGVDVAWGIKYCHGKNINLVTIGCGVKDRSKMEEQYGKSIQFVSHFGQLPRAIERLLKWTFLYGAKRRMPINFEKGGES